MRALVKQAAAPGLTLEDVPVPEAGPGDVKIKITKTAICGTDIHIFNWDAWAAATIPYPMTVGHEFVGVVEELGAGVDGFDIGQRVAKFVQQLAKVRARLAFTRVWPEFEGQPRSVLCIPAQRDQREKSL